MINPLRLYRKHLSRFLAARLLRSGLLGAYKSVHRLRCRLQRRFPVLQHDIVAIREIEEGTGVHKYAVCGPEDFSIRSPRFFGHPKGEMGGEPMAIETAAVSIYEVTGATAIGGTNFLLRNGQLIHPDLMSPKRDRFPAETFGVALFDEARATVRAYLDRSPKSVSCAINLLGQSAGNYAHWMTEILPKVAIVNQHSEFDGLPVLVDGWSHPNLIEAVALLTKGKREIITVDRWEPVSLSSVIEISMPGYERYVPHEISHAPPDMYVNQFSRAALVALGQALQTVEPSEPGSFSDRAYAQRTRQSSNARELLNHTEIEEYIEGFGFVAADPGQMTFAEQILRYRTANIFIAPVGASVANILMMGRGTKALVLAPYHAAGNYFFFSNLAHMLGIELAYVLGQPSRTGGHPSHRDYSVDVNALQEALDGFGIDRRPRIAPTLPKSTGWSPTP